MPAKKPKNHRKRWSADHEDTLKDLRRERTPIKRIAEILGRTEQAIKCHLYHKESWSAHLGRQLALSGPRACPPSFWREPELRLSALLLPHHRLQPRIPSEHIQCAVIYSVYRSPALLMRAGADVFYLKTATRE